MTIIRVRLCELDRKEHGVDGELLPEELTVDLEALKDLPAGDLEAIDLAIGVPLVAFLRPLETGQLSSAQVRWVAAWLAVREATGRTEAMKDFQPRLLRATFAREVDEQLPPATGASETSSEATEPASSSPE